jgi:hypothetical protein
MCAVFCATLYHPFRVQRVGAYDSIIISSLLDFLLLPGEFNDWFLSNRYVTCCECDTYGIGFLCCFVCYKHMM